MIKTAFNSDHDMYTTLAIVNLTDRKIEVIYQLEYDDEIELELDSQCRLNDINSIISFHHMTKVHKGINNLLAMSTYDSGSVYLLIDNFSGFVNWNYYQKKLHDIRLV